VDDLLLRLTIYRYADYGAQMDDEWTGPSGRFRRRWRLAINVIMLALLVLVVIALIDPATGAAGGCGGG
jgi:hypothetical protein